MFESKSIVTLFGNLKNVTPVPPSLMAAVDELVETFSKAFTLFSHCHNGYNSAAYMNDTDIDKLGKFK